MELRNYQAENVKEATEFLRNAKSGDRRLYVSPCGTGKSVMQIAVQRNLGEGCWILAPRTEIVQQLAQKGAIPDRVTTPLLFRNRLMDGSIRPPGQLLIDEAHHDTSDTANEVRLCAGETPTVGYTATPYRGTPQGTAELRELYGEPQWVITMRDAAARGYISIPTCCTVPVLDDDIVEVRNGEFTVKSIERKTVWTAAREVVRDVWECNRAPTVVSLPTVSSSRELHGLLDIPSRVVVGDTPTEERARAFAECANSESILLQVQVVSEGVDLPVRNLIDFAPTMSPVRWLQQVGRAMRPVGRTRYVCCNRNLLRHGYLLEGLVPPESFIQAQGSFPMKPSARVGVRAFGLEGVGKLKPCPVPLANGLKGYAYYVTKGNGNLTSDQYCCIVLPNTPEPLWATKRKSWEWEQEKCNVNWGRWERCQPPTDLCGYASVPPKPLTERQAAKWVQLAERVGLDPNAEIDSKTCQALFVLLDTKLRIL